MRSWRCKYIKILIECWHSACHKMLQMTHNIQLKNGANKICLAIYKYKYLSACLYISKSSILPPLIDPSFLKLNASKHAKGNDTLKCILPTSSGVGVTKAPFVNFSASKIFDLAKVPLRFFESRVYLTGAPAAQLRRHLSNTNVIFNS